LAGLVSTGFLARLRLGPPRSVVGLVG
jgi:hypothetical protein